jgi:hypothetical protein
MRQLHGPTGRRAGDPRAGLGVVRRHGRHAAALGTAEIRCWPPACDANCTAEAGRDAPQAHPTRQPAPPRAGLISWAFCLQQTRLWHRLELYDNFMECNIRLGVGKQLVGRVHSGPSRRDYA